MPTPAEIERYRELLDILSKHGSVEGAYRSGSATPYRMTVVRRAREVLVLATSLWMRTELECFEQLAEQLVPKDTEVEEKSV